MKSTIDLNRSAKGLLELKVIPVNRGESIYEAQVDDDDYEFLSQFRWRASVNKTVIYANASISTEAGWKSVQMHRMIIGDAEEDWNVTLGGDPLKVPLDKWKDGLHTSS